MNILFKSSSNPKVWLKQTTWAEHQARQAGTDPIWSQGDKTIPVILSGFQRPLPTSRRTNGMSSEPAFQGEVGTHTETPPPLPTATSRPPGLPTTQQAPRHSPFLPSPGDAGTNPGRGGAEGTAASSSTRSGLGDCFGGSFSTYRAPPTDTPQDPPSTPKHALCTP